jgi:uncharacterized protein
MILDWPKRFLSAARTAKIATHHCREGNRTAMPSTQAESSELSQRAEKSAAVYVSPFAGFVLLTAVEPLVPVALFPWAYLGKLLAVCGLLWWARGAFPRFCSRGLWPAVGAGIAGFAVWIATAGPTQRALFSGILPESLLGGGRSQFDPFAAMESPLARATFLVVRLCGLAVVVPLVEELFWRGFLARYLVDERFDRVEYGTFTRWSFAIVTLAFSVVHPELIAALLWGAGINLLLMATRNLWACIVMHAVTNAFLGAYILSTGRWELW